MEKQFNIGLPAVDIDKDLIVHDEDLSNNVASIDASEALNNQNDTEPAQESAHT
jgi:hypothetical protein